MGQTVCFIVYYIILKCLLIFLTDLSKKTLIIFSVFQRNFVSDWKKFNDLNSGKKQLLMDSKINKQ